MYRLVNKKYCPKCGTELTLDLMTTWNTKHIRTIELSCTSGGNCEYNEVIAIRNGCQSCQFSTIRDNPTGGFDIITCHSKELEDENKEYLVNFQGCCTEFMLSYCIYSHHGLCVHYDIDAIPVKCEKCSMNRHSKSKTKLFQRINEIGLD